MNERSPNTYKTTTALTPPAAAAAKQELDFRHPDVEKPFTYPDCRINFSQKYNMIVHRQEYHDVVDNKRSKQNDKKDKPFKCDVCDAGFVFPPRMVLHLKNAFINPAILQNGSLKKNKWRGQVLAALGGALEELSLPHGLGATTSAPPNQTECLGQIYSTLQINTRRTTIASTDISRWLFREPAC